MNDLFIFILRFIWCLFLACIQWLVIDFVYLLFEKLKNRKGIKNEKK